MTLRTWMRPALLVSLVVLLTAGCPTDPDPTDGGVDAGTEDGGPADDGGTPQDGGAGEDGGSDDGGQQTHEIGWCRLQFPAEATAAPGETVIVYGRLFVAGLTDQTSGNDLDPALRAEAGHGPDGSDPAAGGWTWTGAAPNDGWDGQAGGEPNHDEYRADLAAPAAGAYDHAFRFSYDAGQTWTYCDLNAGGGSDGSEDGYQPANAGTLTVVGDPCEPNPCTAPPPAACADEATLETFTGPGACTATGATYDCDYPATQVDCSATGETCMEGACVTEPPARVDWCRLQHPMTATVVAGSSLEVYGRVFVAGLTDSSPGIDASADLIAEAGYGPDGSDPRTQGGWTWLSAAANATWDGDAAGEAANDEYRAMLAAAPAPGVRDLAFRFSYDGGTTWTYCDGAAGAGSDGSEDGYQPANAGHLDVRADPCAPNPCDSPPADACADATHLETYTSPGSCAVVDLSAMCTYDRTSADCGAGGQICHEGACRDAPPPAVDWCRLQWPLDHTAFVGEDVSVFGRVYVQGLTDQTGGVDAAPELVGQAGFGPGGSDPAGNQHWSWFAAVASATWDGGLAGEPNNDEYLASFPAPAAGAYDHAFRFSLDAGVTWVYCDRNAGAGSDGSEDGYLAADAGNLTTATNPCDPNPCTAPPSDVCDVDGTTLLTFDPVGVCAVVGGNAQCEYSEIRVDCGAAGGTCSQGACTAFPQPLPGELVITEIMSDPVTVTGTAGDWFEVLNVSDTALNLNGCAVGTDLIDTDLIIQPGARATFAAGAAPGFTATRLLSGLVLSQGVGGLALACGGTEIDRVDWDATFPARAGHAMNLAPERLGAAQNDAAGSWCNAKASYNGDRGTPGAPNTSCLVDWCRHHWPLDSNAASGESPDWYARIYVEGLTPNTSGTDTDAHLVGQVGYGPDGSDPAGNTAWVWSPAQPNSGFDANAAGEPNNDEYQGSFVVPGPGAWDVAFRFSYDAGRTWLHCDREVGPGSDGTEDGYQPAHAAALDPVAGSCSPNPCTSPPADSCASDVQRVTHPSPGVCSLDAGVPVCDYPPQTVDCSVTSQVCRVGACVSLEALDWCRLQWPTNFSLAGGASQTVYGRVYEAGITNQTTGTDADPRLLGAVGYGTENTHPGQDPSWVWFGAGPNLYWSDGEEPNNDEYEATLVAPATPGVVYDVAYRFSADGGLSWTFCDTGDGSADGYQVGAAGTLQVQ